MEGDPAEVPRISVPVLVKATQAPTTMDKAVLVVTELIEATRKASNAFKPFETVLRLVLKVWDAYDVR